MKQLSLYKKKNNLRYKDLAKQFGVTITCVQKWMFGLSSPGVIKAIYIERVTKGAVSVYSWK
jgi:hypothetical protein